MELFTLIDYIVAAIKGSETFRDWCLDTYGQGPTILLDVDEENPPAADDYPIIILNGERETRSLEAQYGSLHLGVAYGVHTTESETEDSVTELLRGRQAMLFKKKIEDVLFLPTTDLGGAFCTSADAYLDLEDFPFALVLVDYVFNTANRAYPFAYRV